jgi:hypothetical protein
MHNLCPICVQSFCNSIKALKQEIGDVTLYWYTTDGNHEKTLEVIRTAQIIEEIEPIYHNLKVKDGKNIEHALAIHLKSENNDRFEY